MSVKHLSQMKPTQRAIADQSIRDALLAIVKAQGKVVRIPIADLDEISNHNRLVVTVDRKGGYVELKAEAHAVEILEAAKPQLQIYDEAGKIDPKAFN